MESSDKFYKLSRTAYESETSPTDSSANEQSLTNLQTVTCAANISRFLTRSSVSQVCETFKEAQHFGSTTPEKQNPTSCRRTLAKPVSVCLLVPKLTAPCSARGEISLEMEGFFFFLLFLFLFLFLGISFFPILRAEGIAFRVLCSCCTRE